MTDIVERLRAGTTDGQDLWIVTPIHKEAADEIERLRADNKRLREALKPFAGFAAVVAAATKDGNSVYVPGQTTVPFSYNDLSCARAALAEAETDDG